MTATDPHSWVDDFDRHRRIAALLRPVHIWTLELDDPGEVVQFQWQGSWGVSVYTARQTSDPDDPGAPYVIERTGEDSFVIPTVDGWNPSREEVERAIADYLMERDGLRLAGVDDA